MKSHQSILWTLRYIEWVFAAVHLFMNIGDGDAVAAPERSLTTIVFLVTFIGLSWLFPANRSYWQKQGYVFLGLLLTVFANLIDISLDLFLYLYIAKSYFLLERKSVFITVIVTGFAWIVSEISSTIKSIQLDRTIGFEPPYGFVQYDSWEIVTYALGVYLAGSIFVILFSSVVVAEQKSRQKAEALAKQVETLAATLERTRIARDIHDSLGHTLTNLDIQLEVAQKLRYRDPIKASQAIDTAKALASQCIEDVSRALQTMRQSNFDINQALSTLIEQVKQDQSLRVQWEVNLPELPLQTSHQVYCIVKEGLINIQKHAHASRILFQGQSTPEGIILELEDDGIGFNPKLPHAGFGLKGMEERVQMLGGGLKINSALGKGTRIQVNLPL